MKIVDTFQRLRALATPGIIGRAAWVGAAAFLERLVILLTAFSFFGPSLGKKLTCAGVLGLIFAGRSLMQLAFSSRTEADLLGRVIASLLHGDVLAATAAGDEDPHAELAQALYGSAQNLVRDFPVLAADSVACLVLTVLVVRYESSGVVLTAIALVALAVATLAWARGHMQRNLERIWELQRRAFASLVDALEGRLEIVASGCREAFIEKARLRSEAWRSAGVRRAVAAASLGRLPLLAVAAVVLVIAGVAARGTLPAIRPIDLALLASAMPALSGVALGVLAVLRGERWVALVSKIVASARPAASGRLVRRQTPPHTIALDRVSFRYAADPAAADALRDVSLTWTGERIVAFAGRNGSGKSTLLRMLLGLAKPHSGRVLVDGDDLFELDLDSWRAGVGFLSQRPYLPQRATIRDAVRVLVPEASDARISAALERSDALASLRAAGPEPLDLGVDTLSIGQRQRVAIARLLCMDAPRMVLLDEPDAALDSAGVKLVADLVRELARTRIVVLSAHSPELLGVAERVITLDCGLVLRDEPLVRGHPRPIAS